ncbi:MAG: hypothetical protein ACFE0S_11665 [Rhodospirillales bacterium]
MKLNQSNLLTLTSLLIGYIFLHLILVEGLPVDLNELFKSFSQKGPIIILYFLVMLVLPVVSGSIPRGAKEAIIFWRITERLPGYRAFSQYAYSDYRIDGQPFIDSIGGIPESPKAQNDLWYRMYNRFEADDRVRASNKMYLLYRDLGAITVLTIVLSLIVYLFRTGDKNGFIAFQMVLGFMYAVSVVGGQVYARKLVQQVLALEYAEGQQNAAN